MSATIDRTTGPSVAELLAMDQFKLSPVARGVSGKGDAWMRRVGLPLGIVAFLAIALAPTPVGLTAAGQRSAAAFALALVWWITEPIPTHVTSLVLMIALVLSGAQEPAKVMSVLGLDVI